MQKKNAFPRGDFVNYVMGKTVLQVLGCSLFLLIISMADLVWPTKYNFSDQANSNFNTYMI